MMFCFWGFLLLFFVFVFSDVRDIGRREAFLMYYCKVSIEYYGEY